MTTLPAPAAPARARSAPRPARVRPRVVLAGAGALAWVAVVTGGVLVPASATVARGVLGLLMSGAAVVLLLVRAPRTAGPSGWRWCAAASGAGVLGAGLLPVLTGDPATTALGSLPGQLLAVVFIVRLRPPGWWHRSRAQLLTTAPLFVVGILLALHEVFRLVPDNGVPAALTLAVQLVPVVGALTTTTALLFVAGSGPERQRVALLVLLAQMCAAAASTASVVRWGADGLTVRVVTWTALAASLAAACAAAVADRPRPRARAQEPAGTPRAATALLPHATALLAGSLLVIHVTVSARPDAYGAVLAIVGLVLLVAHQAVMWRTQRRLTADLQRSEGYFRTLVRSSVDPVVILDDRLAVTFASPALTEMLGLDPGRTVGREVAELVHPDDAPVLFGALTGAGTGGEAAVRTARLRHADGRWRLVQSTVRDLRGDPDVGALVLFCRDVTPRTPAQEPESELLELSLTDPVTGLPNRAALVRRLGAVQRRPEGGRPAALAVIGITGTAAAEDLAEGTGAAVLRALTARLTRGLRGEDWLARGTDGDFVVLVDGTVADAEVVASRLVAGIGPLLTSAGPVELSAVAGITGLPADVDPGEALRRCTVALASARLAGPGSVHRYDDALRMQRDRHDALRADLAGAAARGELRLVFQPVVDLVLHRTTSVEALLRWRHPVFGDVPPVEFVPLAEQTPLISELGRWVLREACAAVAAVPDPDLAVAVNVSPRQASGGELVGDVVAALQASGLPASRLIVEITESVLVDDPHVVEDLAALRRMGVRIAVDDFGTGWSSLAYLAELPVDVLKMDQHFLAGLVGDPQRQALCRAVLQLGSSLGLPVVVEGVATATELDLLRDMGHRYLQGYVVSRPLEADQLAAGAWRASPAAR